MEKDLESHRPAPIGHFKRILTQGVVNSDIQNAHYNGSGTEEDPFIVSWLDHDPVNPMNYSSIKKWGITMMVALATLVRCALLPPRIEIHFMKLMAVIGRPLLSCPQPTPGVSRRSSRNFIRPQLSVPWEFLYLFSGLR